MTHATVKSSRSLLLWATRHLSAILLDLWSTAVAPRPRLRLVRKRRLEDHALAFFGI